MNILHGLLITICTYITGLCLAMIQSLPAPPAGRPGADATMMRDAAEEAVKYALPSKNYLIEAGGFGDQEDELQIYRPGLRNSFRERPLSSAELNLVLTLLQNKTGFTQMRFDEDGFLTVDDRSRFAGGSATARELLLAAVDGKKSINLQSHNRSSQVAFGRVGESTKFLSMRTRARIEATPVEIDFADFKSLRGEPKVIEAFDPGFIILHELCHAVLELRDPAGKVKAAGDCESLVNRIRRELGMPERRQYAATVDFRKSSVHSPAAVIAKLVFTESKPDRETGSRAKTRTLYLTWDVQRVGDLNWLSTALAAEKKTFAGVSTPSLAAR